MTKNALTVPAAGIVQNHTLGAHGTIGCSRRRDESTVFLGGQVEALAVAVMELHCAEQNAGVQFQTSACGSCHPRLSA